MIFAYKSCHSVKIPAEYNPAVIKRAKERTELLEIFAERAVLIVLFTCRKTYPGCPSLTCRASREIQVNVPNDWSKPWTTSRSLSLSQWAMMYNWEKSGFLEQTGPGAERESLTFFDQPNRRTVKTQPTQEKLVGKKNNNKKHLNFWPCVFRFFFFFSFNKTKRTLWNLDYGILTNQATIYVFWGDNHQWRHTKMSTWSGVYSCGLTWTVRPDGWAAFFLTLFASEPIICESFLLPPQPPYFPQVHAETGWHCTTPILYTTASHLHCILSNVNLS